MANLGIEISKKIMRFDMKGGWHYIPLEKEELKKISNQKKIRIKGKIEDIYFNGLTIMPMGGGKHMISINKELRDNIRKEEGDIVKLYIEEDKEDIEVPNFILDCLNYENKEIRQRFEKLTYSQKKMWINHILETKNEETKSNRILKMIDRLRENKKYLFLIIIFLLSSICNIINAQSIDISVSINTQNQVQENKFVFNELKQKIENYINQKKWYLDNSQSFDSDVEPTKIKMIFFVNTIQNGVYSGTMQVWGYRKVYNTTYQSPIFFFNDLSVNFSYERGDIINPSQQIYTSNIVPLLDYYVYTVLGIEKDSYKASGGTKYFLAAKMVANNASISFSGWDINANILQRRTIVENWMSPQNEYFRKMWYKYHIEFLDDFVIDISSSKKKLFLMLQDLAKNYDVTQVNKLYRLFFETKSSEITDFFKSGPQDISKEKVKQLLNNLYPTQQEIWNLI